MKMRKILRTKKVGHTGTLDPQVTGVLPICVGRATKVAEYMSDYPKTYIGEVTIGTSTTTEDAYGELVEQCDVTTPITKIQIEEVCRQFLGTIIQVPPMYSAVKVNGKKLYEYARANKEVERPKREVTIYDLHVDGDVHYDGKQVTFRFGVHCSKGTYVRTLAVDIGKQLGYPAHMSELQRVASGPFTLENCVTFEEIEQKQQEDLLSAIVFPLEKAIAHFPSIQVCDELVSKIKNGAVLPLSKEIDADRFTVYNKEGDCLAIYTKHPTKPGLMKPEKMLVIQSEN
ncbi:tRNA pseudouridine(55) synthase TruB [Alkalihalobacillus sp. LMS39]|uniref:tRNA pseudouridine(55) synthase TruB n=1 Tax=Alkalihalobacillus sp. LMS39 TaxID=2924032 RepID=UPI001FB2298E|nr:tRNA pseudouridine(55) synthase TruB [Alkalihalobacillus sp. LMS39]UOE96476.1 tRNA pseudouridine(55) synthase TruB [Alkalihalobacillus sp. LMS39]